MPAWTRLLAFSSKGLPDTASLNLLWPLRGIGVIEREFIAGCATEERPASFGLPKQNGPFGWVRRMVSSSVTASEFLRSPSSTGWHRFGHTTEVPLRIAE